MSPANKKTYTLSLSQETIEMLRMVKSAYQMARRKNITFDELIRTLIPVGLETTDAKTYGIFKIASEPETSDEEESSKASTQEESLNRTDTTEEIHSPCQNSIK